MTILFVILALLLIITLILFIDVSFVFLIKEGFDFKIKVLGIPINLDKIAEKSEVKSKEKKPENESAKKHKKKKTPSDVIDLITYLFEIIKAVVSQFVRYVRVKVCYINIKVATSDAADTARLYGAVSGAVYSLVEFLDSFMKVKKDYKNVNVVPDFTSEETKIDLKIILKLKVIHALLAVMQVLPALSQGKKGR